MSAMPAMIVLCSLAAMRPMLFTRSPDMVPTVVSMASALMSSTAPTTSARIPRVRIHCSPQKLWKSLDSTISRAASKPRVRPAETERAPKGALSMPFTAHTMPSLALPNRAEPNPTQTCPATPNPTKPSLSEQLALAHRTTHPLDALYAVKLRSEPSSSFRAKRKTSRAGPDCRGAARPSTR